MLPAETTNTKTTMQEYYAIEILDIADNPSPKQVLCRSALYQTREKVLEAFRDLDTKEVFSFLRQFDDIAGGPIHPTLWKFEEGREETKLTIDDYAIAYHGGVSKIVEAVNNLLAWVKGERDTWFEPERYDLQFVYSTFLVQSPEESVQETITDIRKFAHNRNVVCPFCGGKIDLPEEE